MGPDRQFDGGDGALKAIWVKRAHRGVMDPAENAILEPGKGIRGNADQKGKRQVTLIEIEVWMDVMGSLQGSLSSSARRANLVLQGIRLAGSRGRILRIGECQIKIAGETKPCERMEEALTGLRSAMRPDWRGGAFGEVVAGGPIAVGDRVQWTDNLAAERPASGEKDEKL